LEPTRSRDAGGIGDEASVTRAQVERYGLLGREARWVDELLKGDEAWKQVGEKDGAPTWRNFNGVLVTFVVEGGHVRRAQAAFPDTSFSADLSALSGFFVGNRSALPLHWEAMEQPDGELLRGEFDLEDGRRFRYRGRLRTTGQDPWGPEFFAIEPVR